MPREAGDWIAMRQMRAPSGEVSQSPVAIAWGARARCMPVFSRALGSARRDNSASLSGARANSRGLRRLSRMPGGRASVPTGASRFKAADKIGMYFELYDPALVGEKKPTVAVQIRIL